jgi:hypothetical protein
MAATPIELGVHVALGADGAPVADAAWIDVQVAEANAQLGGAEVELTWRDVGDDGIGADVITVADRDALAKAAGDATVVHVFVVASLADKDVEGHWLNGVHWRGKGKRYVILSHETQWKSTLAHELGHYFGLSHTENADGLMTTGGKRTGEPSLDEAQLERVKARARAWAKRSRGRSSRRSGRRRRASRR